MDRLIFVILFVLLAASCSTRIEYEQPAAPSSPNAININTASVADLEKLPGIGPGTAGAVVEFRTASGPFRRAEHLMFIRGVSEKRFLEIRSLLSTE